MTTEEQGNERQENEALKSVKEVAKKEAKKQTKKIVWNAIKAAILPVLLVMVKIIAIALLVLGFIAAINTILNGGGSNGDGQEGYISSYRASSLEAYLKQFSHSGEAPQSSDGMFYKMYGDGAGWLTIGTSDLQWDSHKDKFACQGKVFNGESVQTVENVRDYVNGFLTKGSDAEYTKEEVDEMNIYIEKELVDRVGKETRESIYNYVVSYTESIELSQQQLYALTAIYYNFGHMPTRNGYTFVTVFEAAAKEYEINSWKFNRFIWDNWWCDLKGGGGGHITSRDAQFETYVKGVYNFASESDAGEVFDRKHYIYYTQEQIDAISYAPDLPITRNSSNEEEIFTYVERANTGGYDGEFLQAAGYSFPHYLQSNFAGQYGTSDIPTSGCGPTSMAMILAGFCDDTSITPNTYVDTMNEYFNNDYTAYYEPGAGSRYAGICNNELLNKYYHCRATYVSSDAQALQAIREGKAIIAAETGHILAILPLPDQYLDQGYAFYVLDSFRGHNGPFRSRAEFINTTTATSLEFKYIIEPIK